MRHSNLVLCSALMLALAACDDTEDSGTMDPEAEGPPAGDTYVAGLEKTGDNELLKMRLVDALPAPPDLGDNAWTLEVLDMADGPMAGCVVSLEPLMPAHGHGTNKDAVVTDMGSGRYEATPVDLFMPGLWVTEITMECDDMRDTVTYEFWIEG